MNSRPIRDPQEFARQFNEDEAVREAFECRRAVRRKLLPHRWLSEKILDAVREVRAIRRFIER